MPLLSVPKQAFLGCNGENVQSLWKKDCAAVTMTLHETSIIKTIPLLCPLWKVLSENTGCCTIQSIQSLLSVERCIPYAETHICEWLLKRTNDTLSLSWLGELIESRRFPDGEFTADAPPIKITLSHIRCIVEINHDWGERIHHSHNVKFPGVIRLENHC